MILIMVSYTMISPTRKGIRNDTKGMGHYGASRGNRIHNGTDYLCDPEQDIFAPISGTVTRHAFPYADKTYGGVVIQGEQICIKMFYFEPNSGLISQYVHIGDTIGMAQDISKKHSNLMKPHIHLEIVSFNPQLFIGI